MTFNSETLPDVTVIIPTLGTSPHLRGLLERLQRQVVPLKVEILVVANIPSQSLREMVISFGSNDLMGFEYLETGRRSVSLARNKGLDRSRGSIVLFLDDDAILDDDRFLARHFECHQRHTGATGVGGPYRLSPHSGEWDVTYHSVAHEWLGRQRKNSPADQTHQLLGGNMSFKREHLSRHNWRFDEAITFGGAESGLCQRITNAGGTLLFFEDLEIGHAPQLGALVFCRKAFLQGAGTRWRQQNLPAPASTYINEYLPASSPETNLRRSLYRLCFEFGYAEDPFSHRRSKSRKALETPKISYLRLILFRIRRIALVREMKKKSRATYAALRSAWLNVQAELKTNG